MQSTRLSLSPSLLLYDPRPSSIYAAFQLSQFLFSSISSDYIGNYCCYCRLVSYLLLLFRCFCLLERRRMNEKEKWRREEKRERAARVAVVFVLLGAVSIRIRALHHPLSFGLPRGTLIPATRTVVEIATHNTVIPPPLTYCHFLHFSAFPLAFFLPFTHSRTFLFASFFCLILFHYLPCQAA